MLIIGFQCRGPDTAQISFNSIIRYVCIHQCFRNGPSCYPQVFTNPIKPALTILHEKGYIVTAYLDDVYIQADTVEACKHPIIDTMILSQA